MTTTNGILNFIEVCPGVYRGGQPTFEGWIWLRNQGVQHVIKLNTEEEETEGPAENLGFDIHRFPITIFEQICSKPKHGVVKQAVDAIIEKYDHPGGVFVHCSHGQDRTGLIIGAFRVWVQEWPKEQAWHEMRENGFHETLLGLTRSWIEDIH